MLHTLTNKGEEEEKDLFHTQLQAVIDKVLKRGMLILKGDLGAKVDSDNTSREKEIEKNRL